MIASASVVSKASINSRHALAEAQTIDEIKNFRDIAEA
jgi:hypothetical protein